MCGIIYGKSFTNNPINQHILDQYTAQRSRGYEGFGVFDAEYDNLIKTPHESKILKWLETYPSQELLFHHRFPTSTANVKNAAHPFSTKDHYKTEYILVHNGIVWNDDELATAHYDNGIEYTSIQNDGSFNDSEALLWDVARYIEGEQQELVACGSIAFICMALNPKGNKLYFGRNHGSPLKLYHSRKRLILSSEGKGQEIEAHKLYCYDYASRKITKLALIIPSGYSSQTTDTAPEIVNSGGTSHDYENTGDGYWGYDGKYHKWADWHRDQARKEQLNFKENGDGSFEAEDGLDDEDIALDIKGFINSYLAMAEGYYELAYNMLSEEYDRVIKLPASHQQDYLREILQQAMNTMWADPLWDMDDVKSRDPRYITKLDKPKLAPRVGELLLMSGNQERQTMMDNIARRLREDGKVTV